MRFIKSFLTKKRKAFIGLIAIALAVGIAVLYLFQSQRKTPLEQTNLSKNLLANQNLPMTDQLPNRIDSNTDTLASSTTDFLTSGPITDYISYGPQLEKLPLCDTKTDIKASGAKGNGIADDSAVIAATALQLSQSGDYQYILFKKGNYRINADVTIPENIVLILSEGAYFTVESGKTLTVKGFIDANIDQIFFGGGTVKGKIRGFGYPQWFGAKGANGVNDSPAFQKAVDVLSYVYLPKPATTYALYNTIDIKTPVTIEGQGANQVEIGAGTGLTNLFSIQSNKVEIKNLSIRGNSTASSCVFYFATDKTAIKEVTLSNIYSVIFGSLVKDGKNGTNKISHVYAYAIRLDISLAPSIDLFDFDNEIVMNEVLANNLGGGAYVGGPRFIVQNCNGASFWNIDVAGMYSAHGSEFSASGDGFFFKNCKNIAIERLMADAVGGYCLKIEDSSDFLIESSVVSLFDKGGFYFKNFKNSKILACKINNDTTTPYKTTEAGLMMTNCENLYFDNLVVQTSLNDGIRLVNSTSNKFKAITMLNCKGRGFVETGSSNYNLVSSLACQGLTGNSCVLVGANSFVYGLDNSSTFKALVSKPGSN